ncbi:hypothetical protein [Streptococcus caballi]|nr:hypothetical protein [Streptococcus caballi]
MKLTISATDKSEQKDFHYSLEVSDRQLLATLACVTLLIGTAIVTRKKKG